MSKQVTVDRELLERAMKAAVQNGWIPKTLPHDEYLSAWSLMTEFVEKIALAAQPEQATDNGITLHLLERLSSTLTRLGYATPEGGMEHFNARLPNQLYNLCSGIHSVLDKVVAHPPAQPEQAGLPERDTSKQAEQQGLFRKFVVQRVDGSDAPGGKHHGCEYFVLDVDHDPHAKAALQAYAVACELSHPDLSNDLRERHGWNYDQGND